jgi:hypothetical protein
MKTVLFASKFLAGISGVLLFFYRNRLFVKYAEEGTKISDATHQILVNNHGAYSYITSTQSDYLRLLVFGAAALIILMIIIDLLQRKYFLS